MALFFCHRDAFGHVLALYSAIAQGSKSMNHNTLYLLQKHQKTALVVLAISFIIASIIWFIVELFDWGFPMEPIVVLLGGFATLFAVFWPWKPTYADRRLRGRERFDYSSNSHMFIIGSGKQQFTLQFSKGSDVMIRMYNDPADIDVIALAGDAGRFKDVRDASAFAFSSRDIAVEEGNIAVLRNVHGNYAMVHVHDIRDGTRTGDACDEVTFSYVINPEGKTDFA